MLFTGWNNWSKCHTPPPPLLVFCLGRTHFNTSRLHYPQQSQCGNSAQLHLWKNLTTSLHFKQCDTMYFIIKRPLNFSSLKGVTENTNSLKRHICMHHYIFKKTAHFTCLIIHNFFFLNVKKQNYCHEPFSMFSHLLDSWEVNNKVF